MLENNAKIYGNNFSQKFIKYIIPNVCFINNIVKRIDNCFGKSLEFVSRIIVIFFN